MTGTGPAAVDVRMPRLSESMAEGTIVRWLHESGAAVARGDELAEIETDKATVAFEADAAGVLHILAAEGQTLPVGAVIARVGGTGADTTTAGTTTAGTTTAGTTTAGTTPVPDPAADADTTRAAGPGPTGQDRGAAGTGEGPGSGVPGTAAPGAVSGAEPGPARVRVASSPLARRRARELAVDLATVTGTGPHGRVVRADIESAAESAAAGSCNARGAVAPLPRSRIQVVTAERMARSAREIPAFALTADADMTAALDLRTALAAAADHVGRPAPTVTDLVVAAAGRALRRHPHVNAGVPDGTDTPAGYGRVNVGVAVETTAGLVVPVVSDTDTRTLGGVAAASRAVVARAREGRLTPADLDGATFTVSNLGMFGVREFQAVVIPGQAAILAVGAVRPEPGTGRTVMTLTLACDHRVLDGAEAARFLRDLVDLLAHPHTLLLDVPGGAAT
ncbi:dihydrolipoamide acetyltransferase family protein [Pseudonocardia sp. N23]|uniref:dihydrolipoamide acetyltransferase family protein n=1 Tax=Pseudonocardia sp. N23 TaxID=1987376 RepID=UPI000BFDDBBF|nr:dihydrolipoamide acetyltransferase family protein [Pseudonocardia sp. N23]GAY11524.1 dihydrolipoamide acetyltransferase component of pyruvate dehydrogenase complex [Pseudonocardia sp. N23]